MESGSTSAVIPVVMLRCLDLIRTRLTRRLLVILIKRKHDLVERSQSRKHHCSTDNDVMTDGEKYKKLFK